MQVEGLQQVLSRLRHVQAKVATKIVRDAVSAEGRAVLRQAKASAPVGQTGMLKRAMGQKVKSFKKDSTAVAIVGARAGFKIRKVRADGKVTKVREMTKYAAVVGVRQSGKNAGKAVLVWPAKYIHLVEKGTKRSRAFPFLGPAGAAASVSRMAASIANGVEAAGEGR